MAEKDHYYIKVEGQVFEVSRELYEAYYKGRRKEKYFMQDLKAARMVVDKETGLSRMVTGREDSYERLHRGGVMQPYAYVIEVCGDKRDFRNIVFTSYFSVKKG